MNMAGHGGCGPGGNMPSNGFTGGMRSGSSGHFAPSGPSLGTVNNSCPPGAPCTSASSTSGGDMCFNSGQGHGGNQQHMAGSIPPHMGGYQGCGSSAMGGMRPGMHAGTFVNNGGFHNDYMTPHGQVNILYFCIYTFYKKC